MSDGGIGVAVRRKEDARFLTGRGTYTDDINRPGQLHAYILRSPHAHAEIGGIDAATAKRAPGVVEVFTGADLAADNVGGLPCGWAIKNKDGWTIVAEVSDNTPHADRSRSQIASCGAQGIVQQIDAQAKAESHRLEFEVKVESARRLADPFVSVAATSACVRRSSRLR